MKRILLYSLLAVLCAAMGSAAETADRLEAFPGAEGYGRYTTGGRGGKVYHVTTLEDNNKPGSFRYACNQSGARTIVFDVSGTIFLTSELRLRNDNVTIAGQTAPGDGICIADYPFSISAKNVIIRFVRFRLGNRNVAYHEGDGLGGMDTENVIIDHCSVSWSIDECLSVYGSKNITVQWCIASQSLRNSGHSKGSHGYGGNWGGSGASYHHNLIAHHCSRTPRLGPRPGTQTDERMDMRNNVIYNHGSNGCYGAEGMNVNIVNNYYKVGPQKNNHPQRIAGVGVRTTDYTKHDTANPNAWDVMWHKWGTFYVTGNVNPDYQTVTNDNWTYGIRNEINNSKCDYTFNADVEREMRLDTPIEYVYTTTHSAEKAYEKVLASVGASLHRDALDEIIVNDVRNGVAAFGEKGIIDSQDQVVYADGTTGWPALKSGEALKDTDGDGIPDEWEIANGMNPDDKTDGNKTGRDGYTNLEFYMNSLVADVMAKGNEDGKMLNGNLTFADDAVELPVYTPEGDDPIIVPGEVYEWEISNITGVAAGMVHKESPLPFKFGTDIEVNCSNGSRTYNHGSGVTADYIKFARNDTWTIKLPEGKVATELTLEGWSNDKNTTPSYVASVADTSYDATEYTFPVNSQPAAVHTVKIAKPANEIAVKFGDAESVLKIRIKGTDAGQSGIEDIVVDPSQPEGNGKIYNIMGVEVREPLLPGIYIRDGKKFIVR